MPSHGGEVCTLREVMDKEQREGYVHLLWIAVLLTLLSFEIVINKE